MYSCSLQLHKAARERHVLKEFYIRGSVHRESNLIIVQQNASLLSWNSTNSEVNSVSKHKYNCMLDDGIY